MSPLHLFWIVPLAFCVGEAGGFFLVFLWGMVVAAGRDERQKGQ